MLALIEQDRLIDQEQRWGVISNVGLPFQAIDLETL